MGRKKGKLPEEKTAPGQEAAEPEQEVREAEDSGAPENGICAYKNCGRPVWGKHGEYTHCLFHSEKLEEKTEEFKAAIERFKGGDEGEFIKSEDDRTEYLNFSGFRFPEGTTQFEKFEFNETVDFTEAKFSGEAGFDDTTFKGVAIFSFAKFSGKANFEDAAFSGKANFEGAAFSGKANFERAAFSGKAGFALAKFRDAADYNLATFGGKAHFEGAAFSGKAGFDDTRFNGAAIFSFATFSGKASFYWALCSRAAYYNRATFSGKANFERAEFSGKTYYNRATFSGKANFEGAAFNGKANFEGAAFSGKAFFNKVQFKKPFSFIRAKFTQRAEFRVATFAARADFSRISSQGRMEFLGTNLSRATFRLAQTEKVIFEQVSFEKHHRSAWRRVLGWDAFLGRPFDSIGDEHDGWTQKKGSKERKELLESAESTYRMFKRRMEEQSAGSLARRMRACEKQMQIHNTKNWAEKVLLLGYRTINGFGLRWFRVLVIWTALLFLFAAGYCGRTAVYPVYQETAPQSGKAVELRTYQPLDYPHALWHAVQVSAILAKPTVTMVEPLPIWLEGVQRLLSPFLLGLFVQGMSHVFRD